MRRAPAVGPLPQLIAPKPIRFRLRSGLEVLAVPRQTTPIVAMNLIARNGADLDTPAQAGLASLTAEMMDEGAGDRSAIALSEAVDQLGADLWIGAGRDGSQLTLQVPAEVFPAALDLAADVVVRPRFEATDWERVKHDRVTSLVQRRDQPEAVADIVASLTLFGGDHAYGRPADGFEHTVNAIQLADVRRFHQAVWRPNHSVLTVAGDFDPAGLPELLERAFSSWTPAPGPAAAAPAEVRAPAMAPFVMVDRPGAPQTVLRVIGPGASRHAPERPALSMLNVILGGSFTSRLNFTLREKKGYTYGAGSSFGFFRSPGAFTARSSVFTEVTAPALTDLLAEVRRMTAEDVAADELTKARASLLDRVAEALATTGGTAATFAEVGLYGLADDEPARFVAALGQTEAADLRRLSSRYLDTDRMAIVVVGDRVAIEPSLRAMGLPEPLLLGPDGDRL